MALFALVARADLTLTNFFPAKPIKVMAVGDSITDDCEVSGAWREPLQPLFDGTGTPWKFIGRQYSVSTSTFTKTNHEGYCGAVVAPPGVLSYSVHGYAGANVYLEKIVKDALSNARPDLVLVLIGANDIGRGRNPWQVATNDMLNLLNIIFSNAPAANVILAKITTLSNANISGLDYGAYASNVWTYNAALQLMVNQQRALGVNVFLSDMFSVVNYATMFMSDHLHPNATGLKAIAQEWLTRIRTILPGTNQVTASLIHGGALWLYSDTGADLGTNWSQSGFDDNSWNAGYGRLGFGETTDASIVQPNITTYFRKSFVVPWNEVFTNLNFRLAQTGGAVVWLNGVEICRTNLPSGPISFSNLATRTLTGDAANIYYQTTITGANLLLIGTNVVAVETHQSSGTNAAAGFDLELIGSAALLPPPALAAAWSQQNIVLTWPATNGATFALYATTNLAGANWRPAGASLQTNNGQISVSIAPAAGPAFFRLQRSQ